MDIDNIKKNLTDMGIYQLRELGREVGVASSTTYQKNALIEKIIAILSGKEKPSAKTNQGRPPKGVSKFSKTLFEDSPLEEKTEQPAVRNYELEEPTFLHFNYTDVDDSFIVEEVITEGILEQKEDTYYIRYRNQMNNKTFYTILLNDLVKKYKLKPGDKIKGEAHKIYTDKPYIMSRIIEINEISDNNYQAANKSFEELEININENCILQISGNQILEGTRTIITTDTFINDRNIVRNILENREKDFVYLGFMISPEQEYKISRIIQNSENFIAPYDAEPNYNLIMASNCINYCKNMVTLGKKVILVVQNIASLVKLNKELIKSIFALSRNTVEAGSITTIATLAECDENYTETLNLLNIIANQTIHL